MTIFLSLYYSNVYIIIVNAMNAHTQSLFYAFLCLSGRFMLISQRPKLGILCLSACERLFMIVRQKAPLLMLIKQAIDQLMLVKV